MYTYIPAIPARGPVAINPWLMFSRKTITFIVNLPGIYYREYSGVIGISEGCVVDSQRSKSALAEKSAVDIYCIPD